MANSQTGWEKMWHEIEPGTFQLSRKVVGRPLEVLGIVRDTASGFEIIPNVCRCEGMTLDDAKAIALAQIQAIEAAKPGLFHFPPSPPAAPIHW